MLSMVFRQSEWSDHSNNQKIVQYENMPMQYTEIFKFVKKKKKNRIFSRNL